MCWTVEATMMGTCFSIGAIFMPQGSSSSLDYQKPYRPPRGHFFRFLSFKCSIKACVLIDQRYTLRSRFYYGRCLRDARASRSKASFISWARLFTISPQLESVSVSQIQMLSFTHVRRHAATRIDGRNMTSYISTWMLLSLSPFPDNYYPTGVQRNRYC